MKVQSYKYNVIAVDFDGTLAFKSWPLTYSSMPNKTLIKWLLKRKEMGDTIILWTCRENFGGKWFEDRPYLNEALQFCTRNGFIVETVNKNYDEEDGERELYGRKIFADFYIDDKSIPFKMDGKLSWLKWKIYLACVSHFLK